ncbi:DUF4826 family protein [Colwelliaceae bacterium 6441]
MNKGPQLSEIEQQQWVRKQYQAATKFLAQRGLMTESFSEADSRYLIPLVSVWKINLNDKSSVWTIAGDLPTDFADFSVATNAREAIRHFSFKWQMQAENLLKEENEQHHDFANLLIGKAEGLYDLFDKDEIWQVKAS